MIFQSLGGWIEVGVCKESSDTKSGNWIDPEGETGIRMALLVGRSDSYNIQMYVS